MEAGKDYYKPEAITAEQLKVRYMHLKNGDVHYYLDTTVVALEESSDEDDGTEWVDVYLRDESGLGAFRVRGTADDVFGEIARAMNEIREQGFAEQIKQAEWQAGKMKEMQAAQAAQPTPGQGPRLLVPRH